MPGQAQIEMDLTDGTFSAMISFTKRHIRHSVPLSPEPIIGGVENGVRLTPAPELVLRDGKPCMVFGGYGGDHIPQGTLQVFLNLIEFDLDPQEAVEAPCAYTYNFTNSSYPCAYFPGVMRTEGRVDAEAVDGLRQRGHMVEELPDWWEGSCLYGVI